MSERAAHRSIEDQLATKIAGPEWGTLLGPGHVGLLDRHAIEAAAARVIDISPSLLLVQATHDALDDLDDSFDARLEAMRRALAPVRG